MVAFQLAGDKVAALQTRLKLNDRVFRVQVVVAPSAPPAPRKDGGDGLAE